MDKRYEKEDVIGFAGAKERAESYALIEWSNCPPDFVKQAKLHEATVAYKADNTLAIVGQYQFGNDTIVFNPNHNNFPTTVEGKTAFRWHEVVHRADNLKYRSWKNIELAVSIDKAKMQVNNVVVTADDNTVSVFDCILEELKPLTKEDNIAVQDILSALRMGKNGGLNWCHSEEYWQSDTAHVPIEIFANMGMLDLMSGKGLNVVKRYFPEMFNAYRRMIK